MGVSRLGGKPKELQNFLSQNFGVFATFLSFFALAIRLLQVSGGQKETAIFILAHAEKVPLLVGLIIPIMPALCIFIALVFIRISFTALSETSPLLERLSFVVSIPLTVIGFQIGGWSAIIGGSVYAIIFLDIPILKLLPKNRRNGKLPSSSKSRLFRGKEHKPEEQIAFLIVAMILFAPTSQTWVPSECLTMGDGRQISGSVISTDAKFTYLMRMPGHTPVILKTDEISKRTVLTDRKNLFCAKPKTKS